MQVYTVSDLTFRLSNSPIWLVFLRFCVTSGMHKLVKELNKIKKTQKQAVFKCLKNDEAYSFWRK